MKNGTGMKNINVVGMTTNPIVVKVWQLADPLCLAEGIELIYVEYQREHSGLTLRLYLDKPGGITLDDCANVSHQVGDMLDVELDTPKAYRLEISSPGTQRPLGKLSDFERFKGYRAKIRLLHPLKGQKNFTGTLNGVSGLNVQFLLDKESITIALADIVKAHLININGETECLSQTSNAW